MCTICSKPVFITAAEKISILPSPRLNVNIMRVQNNFIKDSPCIALNIQVHRENDAEHISVNSIINKNFCGILIETLWYEIELRVHHMNTVSTINYVRKTVISTKDMSSLQLLLC